MEIETPTESLFFHEEEDAPRANSAAAEGDRGLSEAFGADVAGQAQAEVDRMMAEGRRRVFAYDRKTGEGSVLRRCPTPGFYLEGPLQLRRPKT